MESIDITDLVEKMRTTFVKVETEAAFVALASVPGLQWVKLPLLNGMAKGLISWVLNSLSKRGVMQAFFFNTALRKTSQAKDYIDAVNAKEALSDATDEIYEQAELAEISAFNEFVRVTT